MRVSVLLATRDRVAHVRAAVQAVAALEMPPGWEVELLVVDSASRDETFEWLAGQPPDLAPGIRLLALREEHPGKSRALNLGIREATGQVLAFIDDDVVVDRAWLQGLREGLEAGGEALQGGIRLQLPERPPWWMTPRVEAILAATSLWTEQTPVTELVGSNMAVVRGAGVPEFCEDLGPGVARFPMGEDADWSMRALETRRGLFWPAMGATHVLGERLHVGEICRRQVFGGLNMVAFAAPGERPRVVARTFARLPRELVRALYHLVAGRRTQAMDALWTLCRCIGVFSALLGRLRGHPRLQVWPKTPLRGTIPRLNLG